MKTTKPCKRGNIAERDKWGHCLCVDCKEFHYKRHKETRKPGYQLQWQRENKEKVAGYVKKWVSENSDQRKGIVKSWRDKNPDKVAEMSSKAGKKWAKNNKGKRLATVRSRQLAKKQRTPLWANKNAIEDIYKESARLTTETGIRHEVDHFFPLQGELVSGLHVENNLQILTRAKNRSKGNK
jgi:hypothetical protein